MARAKPGTTEGKKITPSVGLRRSRSSLDCASPIHPRRRAMNIQNSKTADEAGIRSLIDQRVKALYAKDAQAVITCLAPDYVPFTLAPPLVSTMTSAKEYESWFRSEE